VTQPITATEAGPGVAATAATLDAPAPVARSHERMLVIIPAYNEEGRVHRVIADVRRSVPWADVLVVDDGSRDATGEEALAAGAKLLRLPVNLGYGAALQTGYKYAVRRRYPLLGQIDADGQHKAEHFGPLLDHLADNDVDVVIGSRFLDGDGHYRPARARKAGMALFGSIASAVTRQHMSDPTSGFQVMRLSVAQFFCSEVYPTDYPDADILILLHRSGFRIGEVGVQMLPPSSKSMHSGHRSLYYVYKMSLSILVTLLRRGAERRP
jgi:glycosyltransferase involved in cell wall biosynthesis